LAETDSLIQPSLVKKDSQEMSKNYTYVWLVGAIHEDRQAYKGFLYNVMISVSMLQKLGSTIADFWLYAQLAPDSKQRNNELPQNDQRFLNALGIKVRMLPRSENETSFADIVYEKFHPLELVQYRRIMFLDADILPLMNLDYLFRLVDTGGLLRPNMILASRGEPCNAGLFILQPGRWQLVLDIVNRQKEAAKKLPYPHFDFKNGWGHNFLRSGDFWDSIELSRMKHWRFHAGHSDQGLLLYFTKYVVMDVSIVIGDRIENWVSSSFSSTGTAASPLMPVKSETYNNSVDTLNRWMPTQPIVSQFECDHPNEDIEENYIKGWHHMCLPIYRDFAHFAGTEKPWQKGRNISWDFLREWYFKKNMTEEEKQNEPTNTGLWLKKAAYELWFHELETLNHQLQMDLDMDNWDHVHLPAMSESPLGYMATYKDLARQAGRVPPKN
jgi:hypothetical protein